MKQTTQAVLFCGFTLLASFAQAAPGLAKGLLNDIPLPMPRAGLEAAVADVFKTIDRNHNNIYDAAEQLQDHLAQLADSNLANSQQMPNCASLGLLAQQGMLQSVATAEAFTPMVVESVQFMAAKAFTGLDTDRNGILTQSEVDTYINATNTMAANMDGQCKKFAEQAKAGQMPDSTTMLAIMNQLVALNQKFE